MNPLVQNRYTLFFAIIAALAVLCIVPVLAQDDNTGFGAIVEADVSRSATLTDFNPLSCSNDVCTRLNRLLFPTLLGINPLTTHFRPSTGDDSVLVGGWDVSEDGSTYTFHMRDDLYWSDGQPVTSYDVFYSVLALQSTIIDNDSVIDTIKAAVPLDDHTIAIVYDDTQCTSLDYTKFSIIPAHGFDADFVTSARNSFNTRSDFVTQYEQWLDEHRDYSFSYLRSHPLRYEPSITSGLFDLQRIDILNDVRLTSNKGRIGYAYVEASGTTWVDRFLAGEYTYIENPPYARWEDIQAHPGIQYFEYSANTWYYIGLNLADPEHPQNAFDENGQMTDQGHHPIFGDLAVRQAIQYGINIEELMDILFSGHGTPLAANQIPTSWAFNPDLEAVGYDPVKAARMLESAGWKDVNRDGVRECHGCRYADENTPLTFTLLYSDENNPDVITMAQLISTQLRLIGISVNGRVVDTRSLTTNLNQQTYDAYLSARTEQYPVNPDQSGWFTSDGDIVQTRKIDGGLNTGSYINADVDALMQQALTIPGCDYGERTALYQKIQTHIQQDLPIIPLFVQHNLVAAQQSVIGFDPYPNAPFWNVQDWKILP